MKPVKTFLFSLIVFFFLSLTIFSLNFRVSPLVWQPSCSERPVEFTNCGNWQEKYIRRHQQILAGELPQRYVISVAVEAGTADRLVGTITEFYFALITGRAFQIVTYGDQAPFEAALDAPFINWTRHKPIPDHVLDPVKFSFQGKREYGADVNTSEYAFLYLVNDNWSSDLIFGADLRSVHREVENVLIGSNRGRTMQLFRNPHHKKELFELGLRPETAFSCVFDFLFRYRKEVRELYSQELEAFQKHPEALKIGINVRAGDQAFNTDKADLALYDPFFTCAQEIEDSNKYDGQKVIWYLMSESLALRQGARQKYGEKVLTNIERKTVHPNCRKNAENDDCLGEGKAELALRDAFGQLLVFSQADFHVITQNSGFGRNGAWLARKWHNIYEINGGWGGGAAPRKCGKGDYDTYEMSYSHWANM